jgi:transposase InsO family protein
MHISVRGKILLTIKSDRGTEFTNNELTSWCKARRIEPQTTAPYLPAQNGVAEQMNQTLTELVQAMLTAMKLPKFL